MKNKTFTSEFWWYCIGFLCVVAVICFFPILFVKPGMLDFTETGQIGDTIGGIMGPFVAIAAAGLTFLAFWVQYRANEQLREDITVERFESKFYKMLDIHIQNVGYLKIGDKTGAVVFKQLITHYHKLFSLISKLVTEEIMICGYERCKPGESEYADFIRERVPGTAKFKELVNILAYGYFFYGKDYYISDNRGDLARFNSLIRRSFNEYLKKEKLQIEGYNNSLGHYYRHLYHTISYIAKMDSGVISEKQKYEYAKMLRGQMSDEEQLLLYYNSLSIPGQNWNVNHKNERKQYNRENMGYIARFRMIKNIPNLNTICGLNPKDKYAEEIGIWKRRYECDFFEQDSRD